MIDENPNNAIWLNEDREKRIQMIAEKMIIARFGAQETAMMPMIPEEIGLALHAASLFVKITEARMDDIRSKR